MKTGIWWARRGKPGWWCGCKFEERRELFRFCGCSLSAVVRTGTRLLLSCLLFLISHNELQAQAARYAIIIDELFPDPSPVIGLPNSEFVELKNISATVFNLRGWKLSDGSSTATINVNYMLKPDSFVTICPTASAAAFAAFGPVIGVSSFPSLNNEGDLITLISPQGNIVHAVNYEAGWYNNDIKAGGGWTLEMIDPHNPCGGASNWTASTSPSGGTPGQRNAVDDVHPDISPPALLRTYTIDSITVVAVFDEPLDSFSAAQAVNYQFDKDVGQPLTATPRSPLFNEVSLALRAPMHPESVYGLSVHSINDCAGNIVGGLHEAKAACPVMAGAGDVIINEVLFDPPGNGYDYVELYNNSSRAFDLKQLSISNRNDNGNLVNVTRLSGSPLMFFPGEYRVITTGRSWLQQQYATGDPSWIIVPSSMPSLPDDKGTLVVSNVQGDVADELHYDQKWHFSLIANREGVALERIDPKLPTQNRDNWTSAASVAGFGTPGQKNSQFRMPAQFQGQVICDPTIFSPDNDGTDDVMMIRYQFARPGLVANISIFNDRGQLVRSLVRNATLMASGYFRWDGLDEYQHKLPIGMYVILTETFTVQGDVKKLKNVATLIRKAQ